MSNDSNVDTSDDRRHTISWMRMTRFSQDVYINPAGKITDGGSMLKMFEGRHVDEARITLHGFQIVEKPNNGEG